jgi:alkylation response protein AidB-like acyl-CoA dehydrogenase
MTTLAAEDRTALVDALSRLLGDRCAEADVRRTMETAEGYDPALWAQLAEMGVVGLIVDEAYGGAGAGPVELELVMEAAGAALLCSPLLSSGVLAAGLIQALDDDEAKTRLLPRIADGGLIAAVALTGAKGGWTAADVEAHAAPAGEAWLLNGAAGFVIHAQNAAVLLVVARTAEGFGVFEVPADAHGLTVTALPTFDHTLRMANLGFCATPARRLASDRPAWEAVEQALDLARVALAGDQAGGARRVLEITVDYAKARIQFGRQIGSFQAIKHMAANLLLETESAISAARHAAKQLADGAPDAGSAVSLAAFACADAYVAAAADAIQMHGGVAFTWAHPAHLYLRRARSGAQLFGSSNGYRERYLQQLEAQMETQTGAGA